MSRYYNLQNRNWIELLIILIILWGTTPVQLVSPVSSELLLEKENLEVGSLVQTGESVKVPKLMGTLTNSTNISVSSITTLTESPYENNLTPKFNIGSQSGTGGGIVTIRDSFNWTGTELINTTNEYVSNIPSPRVDSITITNSTNFNRQQGIFNISGVTAAYDKRSVEDDATIFNPSYYTLPAGGSYLEIAMSFNVTEDWVHLKNVRTFTSASTLATGLIYITNSTSGKPNDTLILSSKEPLNKDGVGWHEYEFDQPVLLRSGITYFVVMNETNVDDNVEWWRWFYNLDSADGENEGVTASKQGTHSNWVLNSVIDLPLQLEVLPVEYNGSDYVAKAYTEPEELVFRYNTSEDDTELSSLIWFEWNDTATHNFKTNTSVSFNLSFITNYTYSANPISGAMNYLVDNGTTSLWNVSFSTVELNTTYSVRNRTMVIQGLYDDWNGSAIYLSGSLEYNIYAYGGLNESITYNNQSDIMIINASTLAAATGWNISFDAPNYVLGFNISEEGIPLALPYQTFTMNDYNLDFEVGETGNLTYWIYYPNGSELLKKNINDSYTVFSHPWDINNTFDNISDVNGTYNVKAFWNNSDLTKVGLYTRYTDMIVNSTFDYEYEAEVILDTHLDIIIQYNSTHNATIINNASVTGVPSWGTTPVIDFNHTVAQDPYTFAIEINNSQHNPGEIISVNISAELPGYVNYSTTINIKVVSDATLSTNISQVFVLEWRENQSIEVQYNDTGSSGIKEAIIAVDGDSTNVYNISDAYYYRFNSTNPKYGGVSSHLNLNITASHTNYLTKTFIFNLTITLGETNITANIDGDGAVYNNTPGTQIYYADSSTDHVSISLRYYHNMTNDNLSTLATIAIDPVPSIPILDSKEGPSSTWNITFDPDQENTYNISIAFSLANYENATFIFLLEVLNARTKLQTKYQNNSIVYYAESFDFSVFFNNTDWNENITFNGEGSIGINDTSKVQFLNRTNDLYWFRFAYNPLNVGVTDHSIDITFILINFVPSSLIVIFNVEKSPFVDLDGVDAVDGIPRNNGTTYIKHFSPNDFDEFSISLSYYANKTSQILISTPSVSSDLSIWDSQVEQANHNWTFIFNGSAIGTFLINISFSHENYSSLTFTIQYIIQPADSSITDYSPLIIGSPTNATINSGDSIDFWLVWQSEYYEDLNDSDGVVINDSSIVFISSDPSNGTHYFHYTASDVKNYTISLIFETLNYTAIEIVLRFQVTNRSLVINNILSTHPNNFISLVGYLQYGDIYYFHVIINDSQTDIGVNISTFSWLPTNVSFVNVTSGDHLFAYHSTIIATTTSVLISIPFKLSNYADASYDIRFYVKIAESRLVSVPSTITTYYTQDTNFSLIWESGSNLNAPFSPVLSINSSRITSSSPCFFDNVTNGNYSFEVLANQAGTYVVTLNFQASVFENQSIEVTIIILPLPTEFSFISLANNTIIGQTSPFYFSDQYNISLTWFETINSVGVRDSNPDYSGNGSTMLSLSISYTNGTHKFIIEANTLGFYQMIIILSIPNYADLTYSVFINISVMPTLALDISSFTYNQTIIVEEMFTISGNESYKTLSGAYVPNTFVLSVRMNGTSVGFDVERDDNWFKITFSTAGNPYGDYNLAIQVSLTGYQIQTLNLNITLQGRETIMTVTLPSKTFEQREPIEITVLLNYTQLTNGGSGAGILLASLENVTISFYIELRTNDDIINVTGSSRTDVLGEATFRIGERHTKNAVGFANITVWSERSSSGLPSSYSMPATELGEYEILYIFDPLEIIIPVIIIGVIVLLIVGAVAASGITLNRKRKRRSATIHAKQRKIEQSFEDVKSIRLLIARHESGLQFYSEKTIADVKTDTDALSGMSTALSSFMKELSEGMSPGTEEREKDEIEVMSREGLHMIVWHGDLSSFIIISELRLPDYFQDRLKKLGQEVEKKFAQDLKDFYSADQIPSNQVKKLVRKFIPLHYFSAFILNEGVLTLESIKLSGAEKKMLKLMKEIRFQKEGIHFFFSEQIISHLSKHFNRSKAIKFLDLAIEINLLVEATQEEILSITR